MSVAISVRIGYLVVAGRSLLRGSCSSASKLRLRIPSFSELGLDSWYARRLATGRINARTAGVPPGEALHGPSEDSGGLLREHQRGSLPRPGQRRRQRCRAIKTCGTATDRRRRCRRPPAVKTGPPLNGLDAQLALCRHAKSPTKAHRATHPVAATCEWSSRPHTLLGDFGAARR